jgi:hypothetical protein
MTTPSPVEPGAGDAVRAAIEIRDRLAMHMDALNATVEKDGPMHPVAAAMVWTSARAIGLVRALSAPVPAPAQTEAGLRERVAQAKYRRIGSGLAWTDLDENTRNQYRGAAGGYLRTPEAQELIAALSHPAPETVTPARLEGEVREAVARLCDPTIEWDEVNQCRLVSPLPTHIEPDGDAYAVADAILAALARPGPTVAAEAGTKSKNWFETANELADHFGFEPAAPGSFGYYRKVRPTPPAQPDTPPEHGRAPSDGGAS